MIIDNLSDEPDKSFASSSYLPYYRFRKCRSCIHNLDYENPILQIMINVLDNKQNDTVKQSIDDNSVCQQTKGIKKL
jgi:hypothetical protein